MGILLNCSIVSGDSTFGPHGSRSKCFQVEPVTCWHLSVFLYEIVVYSLDSLQGSLIILMSWTSTGYFWGSTGSSVTSGRFFPVMGCVSHHYTKHLIYCGPHHSASSHDEVWGIYNGENKRVYICVGVIAENYINFEEQQILWRTQITKLPNYIHQVVCLKQNFVSQETLHLKEYKIHEAASLQFCQTWHGRQPIWDRPT